MGEVSYFSFPCSSVRRVHACTRIHSFSLFVCVRRGYTLPEVCPPLPCGSAAVANVCVEDAYHRPRVVFFRLFLSTPSFSTIQCELNGTRHPACHRSPHRVVQSGRAHTR